MPLGMASKMIPSPEDAAKSLERIIKDNSIKIELFEVAPTKDSPPQDVPAFQKEQWREAVQYVCPRSGLKIHIRGQKGDATFEIVYKKNGVIMCDYNASDDATENYILDVLLA